MYAQWTQLWWAWGIRGAVAALFGVIALVYPAPSLLLALLLFGAYVQLDGVAALAIATSWGLADRDMWPLAAAGILGLVGGLIIMVWPEYSAYALVRVLAACCLIRGTLEVSCAYRLRARLRPAWLLLLSGVLSVAFGTLLFAVPSIATAVLVWSFSGYVMMSGLSLITAALRMRELSAEVLPSNSHTKNWRS